MRLLFPGLILLLFAACNNTHTTPAVTKNDSASNTPDTTVQSLAVSTINKDTIILSAKHNPNYILCDLDGDQLQDSVKLVQHTVNKKYGLLVKFGNNNMTTLGLGQDVLQQGFDDLDWVGVFEKASRGHIYWNNVNDEGEIIGEEQVPEQDKIKLPNDGIFIHAAESCGGGVIYLKNGKFEWIQQEYFF